MSVFANLRLNFYFADFIILEKTRQLIKQPIANLHISSNLTQVASYQNQAKFHRRDAEKKGNLGDSRRKLGVSAVKNHNRQLGLY